MAIDLSLKGLAAAIGKRLPLSGGAMTGFLTLSADPEQDLHAATKGYVDALTLDGIDGTLSISKGGTGQTSALAAFNALSPLTTLGDLLYRDGSNNVRLAGNTTGTRKFLRQTGTGSASAAPVWDTLFAADVPGSALTKTDDENVTLTLGGSPSTALLGATSLTLGWVGRLSIVRGGTGASTAAAAFNALSPVTTRGDLIVRDTFSNVRLPIGSSGRFLRSDGTDPSWQLLADGDIPSVLSANARVAVRKNSTGSVFTRRRLNLIEGSGILLTAADDSTDEEVDVTITTNKEIFTQVNTVVTTDITEQTLSTYTLAAAPASGTRIRIIHSGTVGIVSGNVIIRLKVGGTTLGTFTLSTSGHGWYFEEEFVVRTAGVSGVIDGTREFASGALSLGQFTAAPSRGQRSGTGVNLSGPPVVTSTTQHSSNATTTEHVFIVEVDP